MSHSPPNSVYESFRQANAAWEEYKQGFAILEVEIIKGEALFASFFNHFIALDQARIHLNTFPLDGTCK